MVMRTSINHLPSGRWRARYELDGRWVSAPTTFRTRAAADDWIVQLKNDQRTGSWVHPDAGQNSFASWGQTFWALVELRQKTKHEQMGLYRNWVLPKWGERSLDSIKPFEVVEWVGELKATGRSPSTIRSIYWVFHKIMDWAVSPGGLIPASPCPANPQLPTAQPKRVEPLTAEQIAALAGQVDPRWSALVWTLAYGGFRIGEAAAMRVNDLDFDRGMIRVDEKAIELSGKLVFEPFPKTARGVRTVIMPWTVMEILGAHLIRFRPDRGPRSLVFVTQRDTPLRPHNWAVHQLTPAARAIGVDSITPHAFKHTAVSTWVSMGANIKQVAERAGCTVDTVQRVYAHLFTRDEDRLRATMDAAIRAAAGPGVAQAVMDRDAVGSGATIHQLRPQAR